MNKPSHVVAAVSAPRLAQDHLPDLPRAVRIDKFLLARNSNISATRKRSEEKGRVAGISLTSPFHMTYITFYMNYITSYDYNIYNIYASLYLKILSTQ